MKFVILFLCFTNIFENVNYTKTSDWLEQKAHILSLDLDTYFMCKIAKYLKHKIKKFMEIADGNGSCNL